MLRCLSLFLIIALTSGCASNSARDPHDPWEGFNRSMYKFNDALDRAIMKPVAKGYDKITPKPVDKGIDNFISNLGDVGIILNDLFQLKFKQALQDTSRVLFNTTLGIAGLIDVATPLGLEKHNEDFGQTLGYWGVPNGPYLVLPVFGPSTLRDASGRLPDGYIANEVQNAVGIDEFDEKLGYSALVAINVRQSLLGADDVLNSSGADPYIFLRELYLQRRAALVTDGASDSVDEALSSEEEDALFGDE